MLNNNYNNINVQYIMFINKVTLLNNTYFFFTEHQLHTNKHIKII